MPPKPPKQPPNSNSRPRRLNADQRTIQDAANLYPQTPQNPSNSPDLTSPQARRAQRIANRNRIRNGEATITIVRPQGEYARALQLQGETNNTMGIDAASRPQQRSVSRRARTQSAAPKKAVPRNPLPKKTKRKIADDSAEESSDGEEEEREKQKKRPKTQGKGKAADIYKPSYDSENLSSSEGDEDDEVEAGKRKGKGKGKAPEKGKGKGKSSDPNYKPAADDEEEDLDEPDAGIPARARGNPGLQKKVGQSGTAPTSPQPPTTRRVPPGHARPRPAANSSSLGLLDPPSSMRTDPPSTLGSKPNPASSSPQPPPRNRRIPAGRTAASNSSIGLSDPPSTLGADPTARSRTVTHVLVTQVTDSSSSLGLGAPPAPSSAPSQTNAQKNMEETRQRTDGENAGDGGERQKNERRKVRKGENLYTRMVGKSVVNGAK